MSCLQRLPLLAACFIFSGAVLTAADTESQCKLVWGNGDSLFGQIQSAENDTLTWNSPLFADPLSLDINALSVIRFPERQQDGASDPVDTFRVTLTDNCILTGNIEAVTNDAVVLKSHLHGTFKLRKSAIRSLQRAQGSGLAYLGPRGLEGWTTSEKSKANLIEEDDGSLTAPKGDIKFSRKMKLPEKCELYFRISSDRRPDFSISIGGPKGISTKRPRLEMWSDMFVLGAGSRFVPLQGVKSDVRKMEFRIFVDFPNSVATVYDSRGKELGTIKSEKWEASEGILVEAINTKLTLSTLYVSEWDGLKPRIPQPGVGGISLSSGETIYGELVGFDPETGLLSVRISPESSPDDNENDGKENGDDDSSTTSESQEADEADGTDRIEEIPLKDVRQIRLAPDDLRSESEGDTLVAWGNGGYLSGKFVSIQNGYITMETAMALGPVKTDLSAVRHIRLPAPRAIDKEPDRLFFQGGSLGGSLTMEDSETPIRWKPVGGQNATTLVSNGNARFQRGEKPEEVSIDTDRFPDVVHLKEGDVIPGRVESWKDDSMRLSSPVSEVRQLPTNQIKAVELGVSSNPVVEDFNGSDWKSHRGSLNISANGRSVGFRQNSTLRNTEFAQHETAEFDLSWTSKSYGMLTFHLFRGEKGTQGAAVGLMVQPGQLICSEHADERQMQMRMFGGIQNPNQPGLVKTPNNTARIKLATINGEVVVVINGTEVVRTQLKTTDSAVTGLDIICGVSYRQTRSGLQNNQEGDLVTIDEFQTQPVSGATLRDFVSNEARRRALTIPRFRRDNPQTHVLIAPNGDILRGQLIEITNTEVVFESRLERFRFENSRIAAVVRVNDDEDEELSKREATAVQAKLDNGYILTMTPEKMKDGQIVGVSSVLGKCQIPARAIRDLFLGDGEGREDILSYVNWIREEALEPEWEMPEEGGSSSELVGQPVDDFELPTLEGGTFRLSDHKDKVVILDFWASWCGPCAAALPEYIAAAEEFDESEVIFVAVNLEETKDRIQDFLTQRSLSPLVAMDRGSVIAKRFGVSGIPHSVILAPGQIVQHVTVGLKEGLKETTKERVKAILENPPAL